MIEKLGKGKAKLIVEVGVGGRRKRKAKTITYTSKRDLTNQYNAFYEEVTRNPLTDALVNELVESYINGRKVLGIKETTLHGYDVCAERIYSRFEGIKAKELTPYQVQDFVTAMSEKYTPKTIRNTVGLLSSAYENAVTLGQLDSNPCSRVTMPKKSEPEIQIFNEEQIGVFLDALRNDRMDYLVGYELALFCGLRRSEILGLREEHVNLIFKTVSIKSTRHIVKKEEVIQTPKTKTSARTLAMPDFVLEDIKALIDEHHSKPYEVSDYLIQDGFGKPMNPSNLTSHILRMEDSIGLPRVSLHDLRHTFASMLNNANIDIARISRELGHSSINTTLGIYTHVFNGTSASSREIASSIDAKFSATFSPPGERQNA